MANQPPIRPWFRLSSLRPLPVVAPPPPPPAPEAQPRPPPPAPARAPAPAPPPPPSPEARHAAPPPAPAPASPRVPETRPTVGLPTFRTSSAPSSPQIQPRAPPAPAPEPRPPPRVERVSAPSSPDEKGTVTISPSPVRKNGDIRSPKAIKPAVQESPRVKSATPPPPPPSPLVLPPPKTAVETERPKIPAEAEPKTVHVQKTVEKPKPKTTNGEKTGILRGPPKEEKKTEDSAPMRVITIAGENRGAFMEVIQSPDKAKHLHHKHSSLKETKEGYESEKSTSGEEGGLKNSKKTGKGKTTSSRLPMTAFVNSNVQSVNNSLLYHASCSNHDPGVRLALSKKPHGDWLRVKEQSN